MSKRVITSVDHIENTPPWDRVVDLGMQHVRAEIDLLIERGIIDKDGRRLSLDLPEDMRESSETEV